jgi:uncharacterized cupin superfamily protein
MARIGRLQDAPLTSVTPVRDPLRPEWFEGLTEQRLAVPLGISQFGVNLVTLASGAYSALRHWHEQEDEFVLVLSGDLVLIDDDGEHPLTAGDFVAFPAGEANAHHLANRSAAPASFLNIGTRHRGRETCHYPDDFAEPRHVDRDANGVRIAQG